MSCTCRYGASDGGVCGFCKHRAATNTRLEKLEKQAGLLDEAYARGVADERARVVADLVKSADRASDDKMGPVKIVLLNAAIRFERGEHEPI